MYFFMFVSYIGNLFFIFKFYLVYLFEDLNCVINSISFIVPR